MRPRRLATPDPAAIQPANHTDEEEERGPLRRCIVTREHGERARMVRFVLGPDRLIVPDLAARLPGRGIWLSARPDVIEAARNRGAFARAARGPVTVSPDLVPLIKAGLLRRITDSLGLARRAGQAVGGYAKAREALVQGRVSLVVQASDGSEEECRRLLSGVREIPVARPLSAAGLGVVFGREHMVHVAVLAGRLADVLSAETFRLASMSGPSGTDGVTPGVSSGNNRVRSKRPGVDRTDG